MRWPSMPSLRNACPVPSRIVYRDVSAEGQISRQRARNLTSSLARRKSSGTGMVEVDQLAGARTCDQTPDCTDRIAAQLYREQRVAASSSFRTWITGAVLADSNRKSCRRRPFAVLLGRIDSMLRTPAPALCCQFWDRSQRKALTSVIDFGRFADVRAAKVGQAPAPSWRKVADVK